MGGAKPNIRLMLKPLTIVPAKTTTLEDTHDMALDHGAELM